MWLLTITVPLHLQLQWGEEVAAASRAAGVPPAGAPPAPQQLPRKLKPRLKLVKQWVGKQGVGLESLKVGRGDGTWTWTSGLRCGCLRRWVEASSLVRLEAERRREVGQPLPRVGGHGQRTGAGAAPCGREMCSCHNDYCSKPSPHG